MADTIPTIKVPTDADKFDITRRTTNLLMVRTAGSSAGLIAGLVFAYKKGSHFWGYVGFALLGTLVIGGAIGILTLPIAGGIVKDASDKGVQL